MALGNGRWQVPGWTIHGAVLAVAALSHSDTLAQLTDPVIVTRNILQEARLQAARQPRAKRIERSVFLSRAEIAEVRLSPDGRYLSILRHTDQGVDVILQNVSSGEQTRIATGLQRAQTAWSGDGRRLWFADEQGLAVCECAELKSRRILQWDSRRAQRYFGVDLRAPQYAVVQEKPVENGTERYRYLSVDPQGKTRVLLESTWPLRSFLLTAEGDLVFTAAYDGPGYETVIRQYTAGQPTELLRSGILEVCQLVGCNQHDQTLWMLSRHHEDKLSLRCWRGENRRWETVHRDPAKIADAESVLWSAARECWLAISYYGARRCWHGNDDRTSAKLAALQRHLPHGNLRLSTTYDEQLWLVQAQQGELARDRYYLYQPEGDRLQPLFASEVETQPAPPPGAALHPISYRASDGMLLHGYVVLPDGMDLTKAPLIAWLHGGPIARNEQKYDPVVQLLVNRGHVVFLPNFRASAGYGLDYVLAAEGDVGNGRVLADIIEGMDLLLAEGIGDGQQQAVMGISFGGYASLLAVSHYPTRFRFAFAGAPPTDYGWIKQWQAEHDSEAIRPQGPPLSLQLPELGFPYKDAAWRAKMQRESPQAALPHLNVPIYIWAGARDETVPIKCIVHYVGEARLLNKSLCLMIDRDAGHVPQNKLGTEALFYLIELAAHRHFGGELTVVSPELRAFLDRNIRIDTVVPREP